MEQSLDVKFGLDDGSKWIGRVDRVESGVSIQLWISYEKKTEQRPSQVFAGAIYMVSFNSRSPEKVELFSWNGIFRCGFA